MQFFNPLMLIGLAAAAIPILLHLLNLRKLRVIEFSTLRFLKELQKSQVRRLRLQQWLLLIIRTLLVVCAVLAFARPVVRTSLPVLGSQVKSSVVIVLDNTASMDTRDGRGNRFRWAIRQAENILTALRNGDEVAVVTPSAVLNGKLLELTTALGAVRDELSALQVCYGTVPLSQLLEVASSLLKQARNAHRELYIISDFQLNALDQPSSSLGRIPAERVMVIAAAQQGELEHIDVGIDSLWVATRLIEPGKSVELLCTVRNNSTRPVRSAVLRLRYGSQQVAQRTFDIESQQLRTISLNAPAPKSTIVNVTAELEPDACESNNTRCAAFLVPPPPRILFVGRMNQTQYLGTALAALIDDPAIIPTRIEPERFLGTRLEDYDVVILTSPLEGNATDHLRAYLESGRGNVLLFASATATLNDQQSFLMRLGFGDIVSYARQSKNPYRVRNIDQQHPLFAGVFRAQHSQAAELESPSIEQALPASGGVSLITMDNGAFVSEFIVGQGKVLYCAVPPTMEWSDFPTTGLFPVFVGRAVLYLSAREGVGISVAIGMPCRIEIPQRYSTVANFIVRDQTGSETPVRAVRFGGSLMVDLGRPTVPSIYGVFSNATREPIATATVNMPGAEVILRFADAERIEDYLSKTIGLDTVEFYEDNQSLATLVGRQRQIAELWPWFLVVALCFALAEMIIAGRLARQTATN